MRLAGTRDALGLARRGRRALALALFGGPIAALAAVAVESRMYGGSGVILTLAAVALLVGALSQKLEEPLLPVKGILLEALADARDAAREREARNAMAHALVRIREASAVGLGPTATPSPELWFLHPTRVITVDAAGYLQERSADLPDGIFDVALGEPHATLRTSVLRALEVRRADLRPILSWLEQRDALFATVVPESDDPDGLLIVPAGARTEELTLEEVRAAKLLADAFVAVSQATSARERHLGRERELTQRIDALDDEAARLRHTIELEVGRQRSPRPVSPGPRRWVSTPRPPAWPTTRSSGVCRKRLRPCSSRAPGSIRCPTSRARTCRGRARAGRSSSSTAPRRASTTSIGGTTKRRARSRSPIRGLLFLVDGAALPREVQVLVARTITQRRAPWERASSLDIAVALSATKTLEELTEAGLLAPELAARFEAGEPIILPRLRDRAEELHSIVADRLAREGLRVHGRPIGIDHAAFSRLVEYPFDGEDAEVASSSRGSSHAPRVTSSVRPMSMRSVSSTSTKPNRRGGPKARAANQTTAHGLVLRRGPPLDEHREGRNRDSLELLPHESRQRELHRALVDGTLERLEIALDDLGANDFPTHSLPLQSIAGREGSGRSEGRRRRGRSGGETRQQAGA